ncbi:isotrichodermin C-15 hydroxylase [Niveomyces insectorum RCEF 264]|uniref:Isotrichodermin C-15 hydroxylase n=1 Tax=Niveomyces insectorum RCEF 264 TaxID=1081102 RepID=A0A167SKG4_9HYPO|nr:isotrichodermin C-15 hydroxylase [Niveomyces insectorum RCEF 264]
MSFLTSPDDAGPSPFSIARCLGVITVLFVVYNLAWAIYNVAFHPLRHFPGPILNRASKIPWAISHIRGNKPFLIQTMHDTYGPVVRVAPDFLDFTDPKAWKDIYGHRAGPGAVHAEMPKARVFYNATGEPNNIVNADAFEHAQIRRSISRGFSDKALRDQEPMIVRHIDRLIERLTERCDGGKTAVELEKWYIWATFDIIGDLVFGQDFESLNSASHSRLFQLVLDTVTAISFVGALKYLGLGLVVKALTTLGGANAAYDAVLADIGQRLEKRIASPDERPDLIEGLIRERDGWKLEFLELRSNSMLLAVAGSETTATLLSGATYLLCKNPEKLTKLQHEVRTKFHDSRDITLASVNGLEYMLAVIYESLRCYPPVSGGNVRVVPGKTGAHIAGHFVPSGTLVEINNWSANFSRDSWTNRWAFCPERFLVKGEAHDNFEALQPFSIGPRNCIGQNLAMLEIRLTLARMIFAFDMKLAPGSDDWIERQRAHSIWLKPALPVYLIPRKTA